MSTLSRYARRLRNHDWFYDFSDDHRAYTAGRDNWKAIQQDKAQLNKMGEKVANVADALFIKYKPKDI